MKTLIYKFFAGFAIILFSASSLFSEPLYMESLDEARNYIFEKNFEKASDIYLMLSKRQDLSENQKANALFLSALTDIEKMNKTNRAKKNLEKILAYFPDTEAAGDALFFLGSLEFEKGSKKKALLFLKKLTDKYPDHIRHKKALELLEKNKIPFKPDSLKIKVLLKKTKNALFSSSKPFFLNSKPAHIFSADAEVSQKGTIVINGNDTDKKTAVIESPDKPISFLNRSYKGKIEITVSDRMLMIINIIDLKSYLESVVPSEMPSSWPMEALKTQAVISRSYALYCFLKNKNNTFHLRSDVMSQVYKGENEVTKSSSRAVSETDSEMLAFRGEPVLAIFHSSSGGVTEDPYNLWEMHYPYLKSFKDRFSPLTAWKTEISFDEISKKLFFNKVKIRTVKIFKRNSQ